MIIAIVTANSDSDANNLPFTDKIIIYEIKSDRYSVRISVEESLRIISIFAFDSKRKTKEMIIIVPTYNNNTI